MLHPVKSLGCITAHSSSSPKSIQALAVLSDATVRRYAVDQEDLKPGCISRDHQQAYNYTNDAMKQCNILVYVWFTASKVGIDI